MSADPLRLMQVMAGAPHGGAEAFFERMVAALSRAGVQQHLAIRRNPERSKLLTASGASISEHRFGGRIDILTPWQLSRQAKKFQPEVMLAWMSRAAMMTPKGYGTVAARLGGYYSLKYYKGCHHLIGNTRDICDYLVRKGWPEERTHYLPNFVDAEPRSAVLRSDLDTPDDVPLIFALGRIHRRKGFDVLLPSLASMPRAYLWVAGEGPEEAELRRLASALGVADRVRWLGWQRDVGGFYAASDVFVCPSRFEPLGNVVIEAWAHGVPVVATTSAGPSALIDDGVSGLLVPPEDADGMAAALSSVLADPAKADALRGAGREAYAKAFTEEAVVAQYLEFFAKVRG